MDASGKLYHKIAHVFKQDIQEGKYRIGDMLPAERVISEQMNVSRTVVREAMIMLEVEAMSKYVKARESGLKASMGIPMSLT
ncbi:GntR family transcriptional regulator [Vibrio sp. PP-XX7]